MDVACQNKHDAADTKVSLSTQDWFFDVTGITPDPPVFTEGLPEVMISTKAAEFMTKGGHTAETYIIESWEGYLLIGFRFDDIDTRYEVDITADKPWRQWTKEVVEVIETWVDETQKGEQKN